MKSQKTLTILRHAKAENGTATQDDASRALAPRGLTGAATIGQYLIQNGLKPEVTLCSTAVRTRQTLAKLQEAFGEELGATYVEKLYNASANEILQVIAADPSLSGVQHVMVVAHNPGLHQLALKLGRHGDDDLLDTLAMKFPPASLAVIRFEGEWHELAVKGGELTAFVTPGIITGEADD